MKTTKINNSNSKKTRRTSFLSQPVIAISITLIILLINVGFVNAKDTNSNQSKKQNKIQLSAKNTFKFNNLPDRDHDRIEKYEAVFLLRLYGILQKMYLQHTVSGVRWSQIAEDYKKLAELNNEFLRMSKNDTITPNLYYAGKNFYNELGAVLIEIDSAVTSGRLPDFVANQLFLYIVARKNITVVFPEPLKNMVSPWLTRCNKAGAAFSQMIAQVSDYWQSVYKTDFNKTIFEHRALIDFTLPFREFDKDTDYVYDAFIKGAGLPYDLESYYKGDFANIFNRLLSETNFKIEEIALIWGQLATLRVPTSFAGRVVINLAFDCANQGRKLYHANDYREANRLHKKIRSMLTANTKVVEELKAFAERKKSDLFYDRKTYEIFVNDLIGYADVYLSQRKRLDEFPKRLESFTQQLADKSESGENDLMTNESEVNAFISAVLRKQPYEKIIKEYAKVKIPAKIQEEFGTPCEIFVRMVKTAFKSSDGKKSDFNLKNNKTDSNLENSQPSKPENNKITTRYFSLANYLSTGITVQNNQTVTITASGSIKLGDFAGYSNPAGISGFTGYSYFPETPHGGLLVKLNDQWYFCGSSCMVKARKSSTLEFTVNDKDYQNNVGAYNLTVSIK